MTQYYPWCVQLKQNSFNFWHSTSHKFCVQDSKNLQKASFDRRINIKIYIYIHTYTNIHKKFVWMNFSFSVGVCLVEKRGQDLLQNTNEIFLHHWTLWMIDNRRYISRWQYHKANINSTINLWFKYKLSRSY